jgi:hypothetical protein
MKAQISSATLASRPDDKDKGKSKEKPSESESGGAFFLTQDGTEATEHTGNKAASKSEALPNVKEAQESRNAAGMTLDEFVSLAQCDDDSSDYDKEDAEWDSDNQQGMDDDRRLEMTDSERRALMLKVDIDDIVLR